MTLRGALVRTFVLALALSSGPLADTAAAQPRSKGATRKGASAKRVRAPQPRRVEPVQVREGSEKAAAESGAEAIAQADTPPATSAPKTVKPRVYTFGGLDVEGKLKAPQLLYFRSRMRQELDTSSSERRSFLKELEKTADEKGL